MSMGMNMCRLDHRSILTNRSRSPTGRRSQTNIAKSGISWMRPFYGRAMPLSSTARAALGSGLPQMEGRAARRLPRWGVLPQRRSRLVRLRAGAARSCSSPQHASSMRATAGRPSLVPSAIAPRVHISCEMAWPSRVAYWSVTSESTWHEAPGRTAGEHQRAEP